MILYNYAHPVLFKRTTFGFGGQPVFAT